MVSVKFSLIGVLAIIAGLLVLFWPKAIKFVIGVYLLIIGILSFIDF